MKLRWYERNQVEFLFEWQVLPGSKPINKWLFGFYPTKRFITDGGIACTWFALAFNVIGITVGFGIFHQKDK